MSCGTDVTRSQRPSLFVVRPKIPWFSSGSGADSRSDGRLRKQQTFIRGRLHRGASRSAIFQWVRFVKEVFLESS